MTPIIKRLSFHPVFSSLDKSTIKFLADSGVEKHFNKDAYITHLEDIWPFFFIVLEGSVEATKISLEGRTLLVSVFAKDDMFWGPAFFHENARMPVILQADQPSEIFLWSKEILQPIILENSKLAWEISRKMVEYMMRVSSMVDGLAFQTVGGRVAQFLLDQYPVTQKNLPRNITLVDIAARTGTTSEMVCRLLQQFSNNGAIEITRTEFSIMDRSKLESIASKS